MLGETVVCIASGPSLCAEDCRLVEACGLPVVVVNSTWRAARFAKVIYAGDPGWWQAHAAEIDIEAERWTCTPNLERYGCQLHVARGPYNSGMRAIQFAIWRGAKRVILLGYDCSLENGSHWHGDHLKTKNPDVHRVQEWHAHFKLVAAQAKTGAVEILNCSRETALTCFPRASLREALCL